MKAEIIAIGTEILMGYIVNTNASEIAQGLLDIGIGTFYQSVVGDNKERILEALEIASKRSDVIILSGGLGPTEDDITKFVVAEFLGEELYYDDQQLEFIESYFKNQNRVMTKNNYRQALTIKGSQTLLNEVGLSSGLVYPKKTETSTKYYIILPGPPFEMRHMFQEYVKPYFNKELVDRGVILSKYINLYGIGESTVADTLSDLIDKQTNPTIAIYAQPKRVTIRLTASSSTKESSENALDVLAEEIQAYFPENFIGYGVDQTFEKYIVELLLSKDKTLSVAESLTGGLVLEKLTNVPGASEAVVGGFITYQTKQKEILLGIPSKLIETHTVVSKEVAQAMAERTLELTGSDIAISLTGVAGPASLEGHQPGDVYVALAARGNETIIKHLSIRNKPRNIVRDIAENEALNMVKEFLN